MVTDRYLEHDWQVLLRKEKFLFVGYSFVIFIRENLFATEVDGSKDLSTEASVKTKAGTRIQYIRISFEYLNIH